jgi:hypothetical protein
MMIDEIQQWRLAGLWSVQLCRSFRLVSVPFKIHQHKFYSLLFRSSLCDSVNHAIAYSLAISENLVG